MKAKKTDEDNLEVTVDAIRSDILHACDLAEDVAIAYNYNQGSHSPINPAPIPSFSLLNLLSSKHSDPNLHHRHPAANQQVLRFDET